MALIYSTLVGIGQKAIFALPEEYCSVFVAFQQQEAATSNATFGLFLKYAMQAKSLTTTNNPALLPKLRI